MRQNSLNYKISTMSMNNEQNTCGNCRAHGIVEDGIIKVPCMTCACDNGYEWNGRKCYGISGLVDPGNERIESTLENLVATFVYLVRPRYIQNPSGLGGRTVDEYILDEFIPDEGKDIYKEMIQQ